MRTAVILDDDVADALEALARDTGRSLQEIVNDVLRQGIGMRESPHASPEPFFVTARRRGFRPGADPRELKRFLGER